MCLDPCFEPLFRRDLFRAPQPARRLQFPHPEILFSVENPMDTLLSLAGVLKMLPPLDLGSERGFQPLTHRLRPKYFSKVNVAAFSVFAAKRVSSCKAAFERGLNFMREL